MTYRGDIERRLDPLYYTSEFHNLKEILHRSRYKLEKLDNLLVELYRYPTFYNIKYKKRGVPVIKVKNINEEGILKPLSTEEYDFIDGNISNDFPRTILKKNDLVMAVRGATIGKIAIVPQELAGANINPNLIRISLNAEKINPYYFWAYFNSEIGKRLFWQQVANTAKHTITVPQIRALNIPVPPPEIQSHIVEIMQSVYAQKRQKEQEADALLDSIDGYVLAELGIEMPAVEEKKCFVVYAGEIEGRSDPFYLRNIPYFRSIKTSYPLTPLGRLLIEKPQYGANERAINGNPETDIRYIRITDIDAYGNLLNDDWKTAENVDEKYLLEEGDILFARSGATAGKSFAYKTEFGKAIFAGYLIRFRFDETQINPLFARYYTQTQIYKFWVRLIQRAAAQPNINAEEFKSFRIPLPPLEVQNRIVEESQRRLSDAKKLRQEADALVEVAKREAERVMLEGVSG